MPVRVLFVCLGNICRSPTAEGVFRRLVSEAGLDGSIAVDSAGTAAFHIGKPPDRRATAAARRRGVDLACLRARQVAPADFEDFDYVVAMDEANLADLVAACPAAQRDRVSLFCEFASGELGTREVPDPYYGGERGFEEVLDLVETAGRGLLAEIRDAHEL